MWFSCMKNFKASKSNTLILILIFLSVLVLKNLTWINDFSSPWSFHYPKTFHIEPNQLFALMVWLISIVLIYLTLMNIYIDYYHDHYILIRVRSSSSLDWIKIVIKKITIKLIGFQIFYGLVLYLFNTTWGQTFNILNLLLNSIFFFTHMMVLVLISIVTFHLSNRETMSINIVLFGYIGINFMSLQFDFIRPITLQVPPVLWITLCLMFCSIGLLKIVQVLIINDEYIY